MRLDRVAGFVAPVLWVLAAAPVGLGSVGTERGEDAAASDSLDLLDEVLSQGVAEDAATEIASELTAESASRERDGSRGDRLCFRAEAVTGYRSMFRADGSWRAGGQSVRFGARRDGGRHGGFVEIVGVGPLARVVVGGIRPRFGEGLLVGVRRSPFTSPRLRAATGGGAATPTASIWGRKLGAALSFRAGAREASAVVWRDPDTSEVGWACVSRRTAGGVLGVALGTYRAPGARRPDGVDASVFASRNFPAVMAAGELVRYRGRVFAVFRFTVRTNATWSLELYDAPVPQASSGGAVGPGDECRERGGGALHRAGRIRGLDTRLSVYMNERRTSSSRLRCRRLDASARGRTGIDGWWSTSVRLSDERECEYAREPIDYASRRSRHRQLYVRAGWTGTAGGWLRQRYRLAARFDGDGSTGVVGTVGLTLSCRCLDAGVQVGNYSIASGQTGYVVRPGVLGPESVSPVTRTGSDASARVRVRWRGARLTFYCAQPWLKPPRGYLSLQLSF
jgi:hypothetical protein